MAMHDKIRAAARLGWIPDRSQGSPGIACTFPTASAVGVSATAFVGAYDGATDHIEIHVGNYDDPGSVTPDQLREIGLQLIAVADALSPSPLG